MSRPIGCRFTAPAGYSVTLNAQFNSTSNAGVCYALLNANGTSIVLGGDGPKSTNILGTNLNVTWAGKTSSGDYLQAQVFQGTASSLNIIGANMAVTYHRDL